MMRFTCTPVRLRYVCTTGRISTLAVFDVLLFSTHHNDRVIQIHQSANPVAFSGKAKDNLLLDDDNALNATLSRFCYHK